MQKYRDVFLMSNILMLLKPLRNFSVMHEEMDNVVKRQGGRGEQEEPIANYYLCFKAASSGGVAS